MISPSWTTIRLYLHLLAACVWVGGQLTLAGLVPAVRSLGRDAAKVVARQFNKVAWPAFGVLWITGIWNLMVVDGSLNGSYGTTLLVKIIVAIASGVTALAHAQARSRAAMAIFGAFTGLTALGALFLGVLVHG
ncbi:MAG: hypothetical protein AB7V43_18310 [Acidimicrobiia bacterium]